MHCFYVERIYYLEQHSILKRPIFHIPKPSLSYAALTTENEYIMGRNDPPLPAFDSLILIKADGCEL